MRRVYEVIGGNKPIGDPPDGVCEECGEPCEVVAIDEGIGLYEYGSISGVHHEWVWVSLCCEASVVDPYEV